MNDTAATRAPYRLAIVIPAYNEAERLPTTLEAIALALPLVPGISLSRVIVASNASDDDTVAVALALGARLGLPLETRDYRFRGKANAVVAAMVELSAEHDAFDGVLFMDADNATDLQMLARFDLADRTSIQIASRHAHGSVIVRQDGFSLPREIMSAGMRLLTRITLGLRESDTQCGFKLIPAGLVGPLFGALHTRSWVFDAELLARAKAAGVMVREFPVYWIEQPGSKVRPIPDTISSLRGLVEVRMALATERRLGIPPLVDQEREPHMTSGSRYR